MTTEDGEVQQVELNHQTDDVRAFYEQFEAEVIVGFETSGYAYWFEEMLEEIGHQVWIGDPAEIRRLARRRQKNDRRDADLKLELMLRGDFPRLHRQTAESRQVLQQVRFRHRLVKMRTMTMNALKYMALSRGVSLRGKLRPTYEPDSQTADHDPGQKYQHWSEIFHISSGARKSLSLSPINSLSIAPMKPAVASRVS